MLSGVSKLAEREGFAVLMPRGAKAPYPMVGFAFNAGGCWLLCHSECTTGPTVQPGPDHSAAVPALLAAAQAAMQPLVVDADRIFVLGMSNGAMMAARAAASHPALFAAAATVSGVLLSAPPRACHSATTNNNTHNNSNNTHNNSNNNSNSNSNNNKDSNKSPPQVPMLHFHGLHDPIVPHTGRGPRAGWFPHSKLPSVDEYVRDWVREQGGEMLESPLKSYAQGDVECAGHASGINVTVCTVASGGHTWPGGPICSGKPGYLFGCSRHIDATEEIWTFFQAQGRSK
ncbi:unnamed protein product [Polarella glacialis]|uniref:Peptidase S9 prolyl oligopeptidase catalytic domain-containing protein n=2 Tax=Polarella glacialis TaxID=89957 RepID=A0A813K4A9_POLGL|nr:unnamed protein product [Polarella glacialis]